MYPFLRLGSVAAKAIFKTLKGDTVSLNDTSEIHLRCNFNDIDNFLELNNGRIFTLFDLGRTDYAVRSGLGKKLLQNRWGLVVAGSTIQYRRRVRWHDPITIKTRVAAMDERWIYVEQTMWSKGKPCSSALLRTAVTYLKTGKPVPVVEVLQALEQPDWSLAPSDYIAAWIDAEKKRTFPQPPSSDTAISKPVGPELSTADSRTPPPLTSEPSLESSILKSSALESSTLESVAAKNHY